MAGMSGLDLMRHLVAAGSRIPVVMLTAHADEETRRRSLEAGAWRSSRSLFEAPPSSTPSGRHSPRHDAAQRPAIGGRLMQRHAARFAVVRYGVAVFCVAVAVIVALWLRPVVLAAAQLLLVAVVITGWVSGLRPALVAWMLATVAFAYSFTPPFDSLKIDTAEVPRLVIFTLLAALLATMSAARRRAEDSLKKAREATRGASARAHVELEAQQRASAGSRRRGRGCAARLPGPRSIQSTGLSGKPTPPPCSSRS